MVTEPRATRPVQSPSLALADIAQALGVADRAPDVAGTVVRGMTLDSRRVRPGDLYAALPGSATHGATFSTQAASAGAAAILTDPAGADPARQTGLPVLVVGDPRQVLGAIAAQVYGEPAAALTTIGVTGTQGKTTVTRLLDGALLAMGVRSAVVGTVGTRIAGEEVRTALTTPEAPDLHGLFARMRELDVSTCAMEVSSHALVLGRVDGVRFDVAVFTNLGRDHLDFHADIEDYFSAKATLFEPEHAQRGLVCVDDEFGRRLAREATIPVRTYGVGPDAVPGAVDWTVSDVHASADGSQFTVHGPAGLTVAGVVPLPGEFNVANALAAIAAAAEAGLDPQAVADGMARSGGVPGRLERIDTDRDLTVVVDYAHKPDAVDAVLRTLRPLTRGRLVVVIGAGGDRDRGKRPVMGAIAAELADVVIVTDDNPRSEDPASIRAEVIAGAHGADAGAEVVEIGDRRDAIAEALSRATEGDVVLVAGKGHETGQDVGGVLHPFDDRAVVREILAGMTDATDAADTGSGW